jgi:hypothetical protein
MNADEIRFLIAHAFEDRIAVTGVNGDCDGTRGRA